MTPNLFALGELVLFGRSEVYVITRTRGKGTGNPKLQDGIYYGLAYAQDARQPSMTAHESQLQRIQAEEPEQGIRLVKV